MVNTENYIAYHRRVQKDARLLLKNILPSEKDLPNHLDILVICAGSFPSYAVMNELLGVNKKLHFTLVEPEKKYTDFFLKHIATATDNITVFNSGIEAFLKTCDTRYDIIYFEHPETMTLPIILSFLGVKSLKRVRQFRETIPDLINIKKPNTYVIASCMTRHEVQQLKHLFQFSFENKPYLWQKQLFKPMFYGGPYCTGLSCELNSPALSTSTKSRSIKHSHWQLLIAIVVGFIFYLYFCSQFPKANDSLARLVEILLILSQLYFHQPGNRGLLIKIILLSLQLLVFVLV